MAIADASYADDPKEGRSTGAHLVLHGRALLSWQAKVQTSTTANSTTMAEGRALHAASFHLNFFQGLMGALFKATGVKPSGREQLPAVREWKPKVRDAKDVRVSQVGADDAFTELIPTLVSDSFIYIQSLLGQRSDSRCWSREEMTQHQQLVDGSRLRSIGSYTRMAAKTQRTSSQSRPMGPSSRNGCSRY